MAFKLTQFNAHNYITLGYKPTTTFASAFTPDSDKVYVIRSGRAVNYDGSPRTVSATFFSGFDNTEYELFESANIAANSFSNVLIDHNIVVRGDLGDEIRFKASVVDTVDITLTMMIVGRETGL